MALRALTDSQCQEAIDAVAKHGGVMQAGNALGMTRSTFRSRVDESRRRGFVAGGEVAPEARKENPVFALQDKIRTLEAVIATHSRETIDERYVKSKILNMAEMKPRVPAWLLADAPATKSPGIPTLLLSDLHWGEIIDPEQIGGVNEYSIAIAHDRLKRVVEVAIDILHNHMVNPEYPGIVLALGGDMISGDIHEELMVTNEKEVMPVILDLWGALVWVVETMADTFGKVFVPAVTGNHGRDTKKIRMKGRAFTSFDWLLYQFIAKRFESDPRVSFFIPDGPDALYSIYGHRYLLSHGDQFRGGDGMIGPLGPITRGDHKKRSRNGQIGMNYDTLVIGHFHQLMQMQRLIVNGSLCGYNEYAFNSNFGYEAPRQALWITHPGRGITFSMPVQADPKRCVDETEWVKWAA